jgi:glyoxylate reductase
MMALTRRIIEANDFMRNAAYRGWEPDIFIGADMAGKTLGIIGMGRIGSMVAKRAEGFGMKVLSYSRSGQMSLEEVISQSDYVSLHVPLNAETRHWLNLKKQLI